MVKIAFIEALPKIPSYNNTFSPAFCYLKSYLDKYLPGVAEVYVIDSVEALYEEEFDLLGISSYTETFVNAIEIAATAKQIQEDLPICLGGSHISNVPASLPPQVDFAVMNEGEETFREIVETLNEVGKDKLKSKLSKIRGIVRWDTKGNIVATKTREQIEPLEEIPMPDRSLFFQQNPKLMWLFTSRGCNFKCSFCGTNHKIRMYSPNYVIKEIEYIVENYPSTKLIEILDDLFVYDRNRVKLISNQIVERGINRQVGFSCNVRTNLINNRLCEYLRKMNVKIVYMGIESNSERILRLFKGVAFPEQNQKAIDKLIEHGIQVVVSAIIGAWGETIEDIQETLNFILENAREKKILNAIINILTPLPGTYYWKYAKGIGIVSDEMNWDQLSGMVGYGLNIPVQEWRQNREGFCIYLNGSKIPENQIYDLLEDFERQSRGLFIDPLKILGV